MNCFRSLLQLLIVGLLVFAIALTANASSNALASGGTQAVRAALRPLEKPYLQCFTLNKAGEPTAYRLTTLNPETEGEYILDVNVPVLYAGPYEAAVAMNYDFEIVTLKMTDTTSNTSMTTYNLKVAKGESLKAMFSSSEPERPPQFLDCSVKYY